MKIDIAQTYLVMADASAGLTFNREANSVGAWDVLTPADANGFSHWNRIKSKDAAGLGYPWDLKIYDENYVYDWITEFGGAGAPPPSSRSFKQFVNNHLSPDGKTYVNGLPMFPRYIDSAQNFIQTLTPKAHSTYRMYTNCIWDNVIHDLGDVLQTLSGPFMIDHGGSIGLQPTLVHEYMYNGSNGVYKSKEENYFALNYGWVRWVCLALDSNGIFRICTPVSSNLTVHNTIYSGAPPAVDFPCFVLAPPASAPTNPGSLKVSSVS